MSPQLLSQSSRCVNIRQNRARQGSFVHAVVPLSHVEDILITLGRYLAQELCCNHDGIALASSLAPPCGLIEGPFPCTPYSVGPRPRSGAVLQSGWHCVGFMPHTALWVSPRPLSLHALQRWPQASLGGYAATGMALRWLQASHRPVG